VCHLSVELNQQWTKLLSLIDEAEKSYLKSGASKWDKLPEGDCSLYTNLINSDLKPFSKKGIPKNMIDGGMTRLVLFRHYSLINGNTIHQ
jgi:hypothetical protein